MLMKTLASIWTVQCAVVTIFNKQFVCVNDISVISFPTAAKVTVVVWEQWGSFGESHTSADLDRNV